MRFLRRRWRLSTSLYVVGLLQLVVATSAVVAVHRLMQRLPSEHESARVRGLVLSFGELLDSPELLRKTLARMTSENGGELAYYRIDGALIAATDPPPPPIPADDIERLREGHAIHSPKPGPGASTVVGLFRGSDLVGYGVWRPSHPGGRAGWHPPSPALREPIGIAVALITAAFIAFLFARSLARPLVRLETAAEAFGAGKLSARANLDRDDEIGAVARAFDAMADRVNALLRTQREFLGNVSHELRTPLARIRVALDIAAEGDVDAARQSLAEITQDWGDLDRLVESLLSIARLDLAQDPAVPAAALRHEPLDAVTLVERAASTFRSAHPDRPLAVEAADVAIPLVADGAMLRRVLDNVLVNAAKYSEPGAPIRVAVHRRDDRVEFVVADRGIGIDAADVPHLFEPFFRTDRTRTRKTGGAGLGLALAKRIVDAHGGDIAVASRVGAGTTVTFSIPVAPAS